jgi:glucan endo-1,3-alpha-glucosidase
MTSDEAVHDIQDAIEVGFDGFALNTHDVTSSYATDAISYLFAAASGTDFKLFISCDVSWGSGGASLSDFATFVAQYAGNAAYYTVGGAPFVSTYYGGSLGSDAWQNEFLQSLASAGHTPFFVPDFDDASGYPNDFFNTFPFVNGAYSWETAWPAPGTTAADVTDSVDSSMIQQAQAASKVYMMRKLIPFKTAVTFTNQH